MKFFSSRSLLCAFCLLLLNFHTPNAGAMLTPWDDYNHPVFVAAAHSLGLPPGHYRQKGATAEWSQLASKTFRYDQWTDEYKVQYLAERMVMVVAMGGPEKWDDQVTFMIEKAKKEYPNDPPPTREQATYLLTAIYVPTDQQARFVLNYLGQKNFEDYFGGTPRQVFQAWDLWY